MMELLPHGDEHHEIGDGGWLMMMTATNPPLRSPERTPDQPSRERLVKEICPRGNNKVIIYFLIS